MSRKFHVELSILAAGLALYSALAPVLTAQDRIADLRSQFVRESDPVRKAKLMPKLGNAEFQEIQKNFQAERLQDALQVLQQYRDEAESCSRELDAKGIDAERHPAGFKQLQLSLRESLRRLEDLLVTLTIDDQAPFEPARKDIEDMDRHLIRELFPRQPATDDSKLRFRN